MNKLIKIIVGFLGTILVGAIGSGVWERFLGPAFDYVMSSINGVLFFISSSYEDSIYNSASTFTDVARLNGWFLLLFSVLCVVWANAIANSDSKKISFSALNQTFDLYFRSKGSMVIALFLFGLCFFLFSRENSVLKVKKYSIDSMEIVRPYIDHQEYLKLRSEFLLVDSKDTFQEFSNKLSTAAEKAGVKLGSLALD
ncbi:TPA: hypothetical protein NJ023_004758 [Vibrio parahaemolyticus]|nr:hypothetical protein [Vibrio parahaemolyticus]MBE4417711.1 hypothetical protein [Vibrio parahaemolyticus]HCE2442246.1 hypothetical protein [Vibrio parahaemolyticus]HCG5580070.1 hypothetical protein [Vibrio parahaemolyticus]